MLAASVTLPDTFFGSGAAAAVFADDFILKPGGTLDLHLPNGDVIEKQVEKLLRADSLRAELVALAQTYFAIEDAYLAQEKERVERERTIADERIAAVTADLERIEAQQVAKVSHVLDPSDCAMRLRVRRSEPKSDRKSVV